MSVKAIINNGSIVLYYSKDNSTMRYPIGEHISPKKEENKFIEWDYKKSRVKSSVAGAHLKNARIDQEVARALRLLEEAHRFGNTLSGAELKRMLEQSSKKNNSQSELLSLYDEFLSFKTQDFQNKNRPTRSLTDYKSLQLAFIDYEAHCDTTFRLRDIDENFLMNFHQWLRTPRIINRITKNGWDKAINAGNLNDKTLKKRFDSLKAFYSWLYERKRIPDFDFLKKYCKGLTVEKKQKVTLTVEEIFAVYNYKNYTGSERKAINILVFACFTGLRYGDIQSFDPALIDKNNVYRCKTQKTKEFVQIPLCSTVLEILEQIGNDLNQLRMSNQNLNYYLKDGLKRTGLFNGMTNTIGKNGELLRRYEAVTIHKGRDSFITNLVNTTPLNEVMKYTGHKKLATLQIYLDQSRTVNPKFINEMFVNPA